MGVLNENKNSIGVEASFLRLANVFDKCFPKSGAFAYSNKRAVKIFKEEFILTQCDNSIVSLKSLGAKKIDRLSELVSVYHQLIMTHAVWNKWLSRGVVRDEKWLKLLCQHMKSIDRPEFLTIQTLGNLHRQFNCLVQTDDDAVRVAKNKIWIHGNGIENIGWLHTLMIKSYSYRKKERSIFESAKKHYDKIKNNVA